jgi:LuxR family maltose regulon positive regulatory protein
MYLMTAQVLSFTYDILGRQEDASTLSDSLVTMILNGRGTSFLANAKMHRADLALRQGFQSLAVNGIKEIQIGKTPPGYHFVVPELLIAKILLSQKKSDCLKQAEGILRTMCDHFTAIHNTRFLVEVFALQALLQEALSNVQEADKKLAEALMLAEPGGMVRVFVDLGTVMEKLLDRQSSENPLAEYILKLKNAFTENGSEKDWNNKLFHTSVLPSNPLTNREQEILELFAQRLSNQEIAEKLCIADNTVKRHATNIFRKLDVENRRKAVEQAYFLGITN